MIGVFFFVFFFFLPQLLGSTLSSDEATVILQLGERGDNIKFAEISFSNRSSSIKFHYRRLKESQCEQVQVEIILIQLKPLNFDLIAFLSTTITGTHLKEAPPRFFAK